MEHQKGNERGGRSNMSGNKPKSKWGDRHKEGRTNKESKKYSLPTATPMDLYNGAKCRTSH